MVYLQPFSSSDRSLCLVHPQGKAASRGSCCCQQEPTSQEAECNHQMQLRVQQFWKHWKSEYLQELQKDTVRASRNNGIRLGRMAILIDEMLPVTRWPLARITKIHPGKDGIPRVVSVRTAHGDMTRPITKICLLPDSQE
ncbi:uncharacterized protein LOC125956186 [Anopheles darlingi]|uniref:uncharacterized protein LOC125956186 n=1 Tax=Anopheles darlingi TaxID=43151 RepID=UPI0021003B67|nr:uncharacterized protein LOC125956186 [Anopheles darlingi]